MSVDLSKIKPGDEVTVRLVVAKDCRNGETDYRGFKYLVCEDPYKDSNPRPFVVLAEDVLSHTPRALAVGDRVTWASGVHPARTAGRVVHVDGPHAWVRADGEKAIGGHVLWLDSLERVDAD